MPRSGPPSHPNYHTLWLPYSLADITLIVSVTISHHNIMQSHKLSYCVSRIKGVIAYLDRASTRMNIDIRSRCSTSLINPFHAPSQANQPSGYSNSKTTPDTRGSQSMPMSVPHETMWTYSPRTNR